MTTSPTGSNKELAGDIAIVGMACMFPGAPDVETFWQNIISKVYAITDPPPESWHSDIFYDRESNENDRVYCKRGGYLGPIAFFDPLEHGVMPRTALGGEPDQWLALQLAKHALRDAGYGDEIKESKKTAIVLGKGTYLNRGNLSMVQHSLVIDQTLDILRKLHPQLTEEDLQLVRHDLKSQLPPFNAETAPGLVPNVMTGRVANRLDLMGPNYTVDAACASSLVAVDLGARGLLSREFDLAVVGGSQVTVPVPTLTLFCQLKALSLGEEIRPFDEGADGTLLSEGLGMVVMKRREDAERDGNRIYAIVKGVGLASDGRALSVLAPRVEGQELALRRAYERAGISPRTVALIEAHGTATLAGDAAEVQSLTRVFGQREGTLPWCALGTVKSMIGHTMPAAGIAGLIKSALALYHKVLPPTLNVGKPSEKLQLEKTPFYINTEVRPWIHGSPEAPRRAGVNAFGFGGINAHVILEEQPLPDEASAGSHLHRWETELFLLGGHDRSELVRHGERLLGFLARSPEVSLKDLAFTINDSFSDRDPGSGLCLAVIASSQADLDQKLRRALGRLEGPGCGKIKDVSGIYFFDNPVGRRGKLAFLFPGEGAQYPNMLADLCVHFPEVRACFDEMDQLFTDHGRGFLPSDFIFPRPAFTEEERTTSKHRLWQMDVAIEALVTADRALFELMGKLGIRADAMVGHSTGEYAAMRAAGMLDEARYQSKVLELNQLYEGVAEKGGIPEAALLAVGAGRDQVASLAREIGGNLQVAMDNCPHQAVLVGGVDEVEKVRGMAQSRGLICEDLPFTRAYHTALFEPYAEVLLGFLESWIVSTPKIPLYSCTTMAPYPDDLEMIHHIAHRHWIRPVEFRRTIERMYADGFRVFLEVGPRGNLTSFVESILQGRPHVAVSANVMRRSGITQIHHLIGMLAAQGVTVRLDRLYQRRSPKKLELEPTLEKADKPKRPSQPIKLATGWPPMEISEETTRRLQERLRIPVTPEVGEPVRQAILQPGEEGRAVVQDGGGPTAWGIEATPIMSAYFRTMDEFLALQQGVVESYLEGVWVNESPGAVQGETLIPETTKRSPNDTGLPSLPLIHHLLSKTSEELAAVAEISLETCPFLRDHTLGRQVSVTDPGLTGLPVLPLTMSMEIMAEAASVLVPDKLLVAMEEVRAHRWIDLQKDPVILKVVARRKTSAADSRVDVCIYNTKDSGESPVAEGTMVLANAYPSPPVVSSFPLRNERPSRWRPDQLYEELIFHGPAFQGVVSMDRWGEDGAEATLEVLPFDGLLRPGKDGDLKTDPVLLDQPGQIIAFWTADHLERGYVIFPFRLEELHLYGSHLPAHERVRCQARISLVEGFQVRSDLDVVREDGRVWARFVGWWDKRFDLPQGVRFLLSPRDLFLSRPLRQPFESLGSPATHACRVGEDDLPDGWLSSSGGIWRRVLAHLVLSRRERELWLNLRLPEERKLEWLFGRVAAKDAVRRHLEERHRLFLCPADIEILSDSEGRPLVQGPWTTDVRCRPEVSLSHSAGVAVAVAGDCEASLGVDIERIDRMNDDVDRLAFTSRERHLLSELHGKDRNGWALRFWCAKEAVAKAVGAGRVGGPQALEVEAVERESGLIRVGLKAQSAKAENGWDGLTWTAVTAREGDFVLAATLCRCEERAGREA